MMTEPFEYNFVETDQYNGHRCPPQAVKGENAREVGLLDDNLPLDTEKLNYNSNSVSNDNETQTDEPSVTPDEPVVTPDNPVVQPDEPVEP